jgi:uncharacterized membrane protein YdfJ with MMPL/SSD domain
MAGAVGATVATRLSTSGANFEDPGSESVAARTQLERASDSQPDPAVLALVQTPEGVDTAIARTRVARVAARLARDPAVAGVETYYTRGSNAFVARNGRSTFVAAELRPISPRDEKTAAKRIEASLAHESHVQLGGWLIANEQIATQVEKDLVRAELLVFPLLFVLSLLVFRGLVAAALPPIGGAVTILSTFVCLRIVNAVTPLAVFAVNLVTGLGLGLAIDYSLFIVSRYREEIARAGTGREALRRTMTTAGRTVFFSSLTVVLSLAALLAFPQPFLYSLGIGGVLAAVFAGANALIVLPAILAALGPRVNALAPARLRRAAERSATEETSGFWYRLSQLVMRRAIVVAVASAAFLVALGVPFFTGVKFTGIDAGVLPRSANARQVSDALQTNYRADRSSPIYLAIAAPRSAAASVHSFGLRLRTLPDAAAVSRAESVGRDTWRIDVYSRHGVLARESKDLVRDIRDLRPPFPVRAGGQTALFLDLESSLRSHLPLGIGILALATFLVLFAATGSVVLPVKSFVMNLFTLSATYGFLVLIFQDGRLESVLRYASQRGLDATMPIFIAAVVFALSTDYAVFLLTRIKEARDAGAEDKEAVARGLERTGRIITSAALLFSFAVGALATSKIVFIKELALGMALAVIIDATIVRGLLAPSLMALLGGRNWWAPGPLRRLHDRFGWSEAAPRRTAPAPRP